MTNIKHLEKGLFSKTNKRLDLRGDLWLTAFKKIAVSLSAPFSMGGFAPQALYQKDDYLETAAFLSMNELSADQGCDLFNAVRKKLNIPKEWIFRGHAPSLEAGTIRKNQTRLTPNKTCFLAQLRKHSLEGLEEEWEHSIDTLLGFIKKKFTLKRSVRVAFDYHLIPFYGDPGSEYVHKSLAKHGTNYFFKYITCCICLAGYRVKLGIKMLKKEEKPLEWMRSSLERFLALGLKIEWVLLDRGFYSISTCKMIDELGLTFLMPAKKTMPIKKLSWRYYNKQIPTHQDYILKNVYDEFRGTVIFATKQGNLNIFRRECQEAALTTKQVIKKIWVYFTNWCPPTERRARLQKIREIPGIYKSRWGIETAYRMIKKFHIPTCSRVPSTRYFFFLFQSLRYNSWVLTNLFLILRFDKAKNRPLLTYSVFTFELRLLWTQWFTASQKPPPRAKKSPKLARIRSFFRRDRT